MIVTATSPSDDLDVAARTVKPIHKRNAYKYITFDRNVLENSQMLPSVPCITIIDWNKFDPYCSWRRVHPTAISAMTAALPCVVQCLWHIVMHDRRLGLLRKEIRSALAETLDYLPDRTPALKILDIRLEDRNPMNERAEVER